MVKAFTLSSDEWDVMAVNPSRLSPLIARFYGAAEYEYNRQSGMVDVYGPDGHIRGSFDGTKNPQFISETDGSVSVWLTPLEG